MSEKRLLYKLRYLKGALSLPTSVLKLNLPLLVAPLLARIRPRTALLLQLGEPLPPAPLLAQLLQARRASFVAYLVAHRHPTIHTEDDYNAAVKWLALNADVMREWEAALLARAAWWGLLPATPMPADIA
jgi:hypothetical protein